MVRIGPSSATGGIAAFTRGSIKKTRVSISGGTRVDTAADGCPDGIDHPHQVGFVIETNIGEKDLALAFDVDHAPVR